MTTDLQNTLILAAYIMAPIIIGGLLGIFLGFRSIRREADDPAPQASSIRRQADDRPQPDFPGRHPHGGWSPRGWKGKPPPPAPKTLCSGVTRRPIPIQIYHR